MDRPKRRSKRWIAIFRIETFNVFVFIERLHSSNQLPVDDCDSQLNLSTSRKMALLQFQERSEGEQLRKRRAA